MAAFADLIVRIGANTKELSSALGRVDSDLKKSQRTFSRFGSGFKDLGQSMTLGLTLPIAGLGAAVATFAGDFEGSMNRVKALSGATGASFNALREQAKELGASTKFSASEAADGMAFLSQAGFSAQDTLAAMPGLLDLAASGGLELAAAADIASNVLSGFGESADQAGRAADIMAKTAASSNTSVEQLGQAMSFVAPVAAQVGLSMEATSAMIGKLGDAGIQATRAGTNMRGMILGLSSPSKDAANTLDHLGVATRGVDGSMRPLPDILNDLGNATNDAAHFAKIFGRENASAAAVLAGVGKQAISEFTTELENSSGAAGEMAKTMNQGFQGAMRELKSAFEGLAIAIGESGVLDAMTSIVQSVTGFVRDLAATNPEILKWGAILAGAAAAIGPLIIAIGSLGGAIAGIQAAGFASSLGGMTAALPLLGKAAVVAGAAFAAWKLGEWIADNVLPDRITDFDRALAKLATTMFGLSDGTKELERAQSDMDKVVGLLEKKAKALGITITKTGKSQKEYKDELVAAIKETKEYKKRVEDANDELKDQESQARDTAAKVDDYTESVKSAKEEAKRFSQEQDIIVEMANLEMGAKLAQERLDNGLTPALSTLGTTAPTVAGQLTQATSKVLDITNTVTNGKVPLDAYTEAMKTLGIESQENTAQKLETLRAALETVRIEVENGKRPVDDLKAAEKAYADGLAGATGATAQTDGFGKALQSVSTTITNLGQGIADAFISGGSVKEKFVGALGEMKKAVIALISEQVMGALVKQLTGLIGLTDGLSGLGKTLRGIFSGGASAVGSAAGAAGNVAGSVGGAAGSVGGAVGAAAGGALGAVGAVGAAVGAVSSIIGNFQMAKMETTLNAIEENTRRGTLFLGDRGDGGILGVLFNHSDWLQTIMWSNQAQEKTAFDTFQKSESIDNKMTDLVGAVRNMHGDLAGGGFGGPGVAGAGAPGAGTPGAPGEEPPPPDPTTLADAIGDGTRELLEGLTADPITPDDFSNPLEGQTGELSKVIGDSFGKGTGGEIVAGVNLLADKNDALLDGVHDDFTNQLSAIQRIGDVTEEAKNASIAGFDSLVGAIVRMERVLASLLRERQNITVNIPGSALAGGVKSAIKLNTGGLRTAIQNA